jgi:thiol-disulfide isomerase/thioredoxin
MGFGPQGRGDATRREMVAPALARDRIRLTGRLLHTSTGVSVSTVTPTRRLALLALIPPIAVAFLTVAYLTRGGDQIDPVIELSGRMPAISGPTLTGDRVTPATYRGEVVVVNFWGSWCGPCRKEQPGLERMWREYRDRDVQFLGVNVRDDPARARTYLEEFDVTYPSVTDDGLLSHAFRVPYYPATILVDRSGEMRSLLVGAQAEAVVRGYIEELLRA